MKKVIVIAFLFLHTAIVAKAQNPASPPLHPDASLPERTFEVFWQTFEDHYAFFKLRKVDWKATYDKYRRQVSADMSDDSLFNTLAAMIKPLQDDHVNLYIPGKRGAKSEKPSQFLAEFPKGEPTKKFWEMVDASLKKAGFGELKTEGEKYRDVPLFSYTKSKSVGYIRIRRSFVSPNEDDGNKDALVAGGMFDAILLGMLDAKKIIIDLRSNIGGNDEFSYAVAGRFAQKRMLGHYKQTRKGGYEDFGPRQNWYIEPAGLKYTGKVIVLTNDQTASAGDVMAMIMGELPQVTTVGNHTLGIYSDMYGFTMPNKWEASLSNQRYFDSKGVCHEGVGTQPDIKVLNTRKDLQTKIDPVLAKALQVLK